MFLICYSLIMKIQNIENRIVYFPSINEGEYLFDGIPYASMQVLEIIGSEGVHHIDQKLKNYLLQRLEMFGTANKTKHGFSANQRFFDVQEQIILDVKSKIGKNEGGKYDYTIDVNNDKSTLDIFRSKKEQYSLEKQIKDIKRGIWFENE